MNFWVMSEKVNPTSSFPCGPRAAIKSVEFFDGKASLGNVTAGPYVLNHDGLSVGCHTLSAKVTDGSDRSTPPLR